MTDSRADRERWTARYAAGSGERAEPSAWVMQAMQHLPPGALVLDLAAGAGRHARAIAGTGRPVIALDLVESAVQRAVRHPLVTGIVADTAALPLSPGTLPAILCVNFLDRALFPRLIALLALRGILVYETYTAEHLTLAAAHGPRHPDHTLRPGELKTLVAPLAILEYHEGLRRDAAGERHVASVVARKDA